jgi:class 3 adenylate cyclase
LTGERVERRLAAIVAADVAGYSRLMGNDEAGTLARVKALRRELIDPEITEHKGRVVKTTGDVILIEFPERRRSRRLRRRRAAGDGVAVQPRAQARWLCA